MLQLPFFQLVLHQPGDVIPQKRILGKPEDVEQLLHLERQITPSSLAEHLTLRFAPFCTEHLIPQIVERILVVQQIAVHHPANPHLQDRNQVHQKYLALQMFFQAMLRSSHPGLVRLVVLLDGIAVTCDLKHSLGSESHRSEVPEENPHSFIFSLWAWMLWLTAMTFPLASRSST
jgi:hypothetical protein